ncbi:MAG: hypothetical protein GY842_02215, partial [bacterium]|nr:hypothetical protein [bacterium]
MTDSFRLVRWLGPRWVLWRAFYALRKKSGLMKRGFPTPEFADLSLADVVCPGTPTEPVAYRSFREASASRFFFPLGRPPDADSLGRVMQDDGREQTLKTADDYCAGRFLFYSRHLHDLGQPVNWLLNPFTGAQHEVDTHWVDYTTFSASMGDIKDVWESSRFACAFWLGRAYALTGDEKYAEAFWGHFESWCAQNPPNRGPNWKCGQETALRSMAWCFALYAMWGADASTPERVTALVTVLAFQGERIVRNIGYAVSQ